MDQAYSNELRSDTASILIPLIAGTTTLATLLAAIADQSFFTSWHFWLSVGLSLASGIVGRYYLKQDRATLGTVIFTAVHLLIFSLLLYRNWMPGSMIPYLFAILIIASSMFTQPDYGFITWGAATLLTTLTLIHHTEGFIDLVQSLIGPVV